MSTRAARKAALLEVAAPLRLSELLPGPRYKGPTETPITELKYWNARDERKERRLQRLYMKRKFFPVMDGEPAWKVESMPEEELLHLQWTAALGKEEEQLPLDAEEWLDVMDELDRARKAPERVAASTYVWGVEALAWMGRWREATDLLMEMRRSSIPPPARLYNVALVACADAGQHPMAKFIYSRMQQSQIKPDQKTYEALVCAMCLRAHISTPHDLVDKMRREDLRPSHDTYHYLMHGASAMGEWKRAFQFLTQMSNKGPKPKDVSYSIGMEVMCRHNMLRRALLIRQQMKEKEFVPDAAATVALVAAASRAKNSAALDLAMSDLTSLGIAQTAGVIAPQTALFRHRMAPAPLALHHDAIHAMIVAGEGDAALGHLDVLRQGRGIGGGDGVRLRRSFPPKATSRTYELVAKVAKECGHNNIADAAMDKMRTDEVDPTPYAKYS